MYTAMIYQSLGKAWQNYVCKPMSHNTLKQLGTPKLKHCDLFWHTTVVVMLLQLTLSVLIPVDVIGLDKSIFGITGLNWTTGLAVIF